MYKYILCDLDNTLLNFDAGEKEALSKVFNSEKIEFNETNIKIYKDINSELWKSLEKGLIDRNTVLTMRFVRFFKEFNLNVDGVKKEEIFRESLNNSHILMNGAEMILEYFKERNMVICSATNGVAHTQIKRMKDSGIYGYFKHHFISETVGYEKPNREFFEYCLKELNISNKKEVLMIGDTYSSDIVGANNIGIDSCYLGDEIVDATYNVNDLTEIKAKIFNM